MNKFLNLLVKSNLSQEEIKRIKKEIRFLINNSILYPDPDPIEISNQKLNLREIIHIRWERFESLDDYFQWKNESFELLKKNRLSIKELSDMNIEDIKSREYQNRMMFHYHAINIV